MLRLDENAYPLYLSLFDEMQTKSWFHQLLPTHNNLLQTLKYGILTRFLIP